MDVSVHGYAADMQLVDNNGWPCYARMQQHTQRNEAVKQKL